MAAAPTGPRSRSGRQGPWGRLRPAQPVRNGALGNGTRAQRAGKTPHRVHRRRNTRDRRAQPEPGHRLRRLGEPVPRVRARLRLLLRQADARIPGILVGARLRAEDPGQAQGAGTAEGSPRAPVVEAPGAGHLGRDRRVSAHRAQTAADAGLSGGAARLPEPRDDRHQEPPGHSGRGPPGGPRRTRLRQRHGVGHHPAQRAAADHGTAHLGSGEASGRDPTPRRGRRAGRGLRRPGDPCADRRGDPGHRGGGGTGGCPLRLLPAAEAAHGSGRPFRPLAGDALPGQEGQGCGANPGHARRQT